MKKDVAGKQGVPQKAAPAATDFNAFLKQRKAAPKTTDFNAFLKVLDDTEDMSETSEAAEENTGPTDDQVPLQFH